MGRPGRIMGASGLLMLAIAVFRDWVRGWMLDGYGGGVPTIAFYAVALGQLCCARMFLLLDEETAMTRNVHDDGCNEDHHPDAVCNPEIDDDDPTLEALLNEEDEAVATGRAKRRELVTIDGPNPLACPTCGQVGNWRRDPDDPNRVLCAVDGALVMVEICPVEKPHCPNCGSTENFNPGFDYSTCCDELATTQKDCRTWQAHDGYLTG